jgi:hypothetical protein
LTDSSLGGEGSSRLTVNKDREGSGGNAGTDETNEVRLETKTAKSSDNEIPIQAIKSFS